MLGTPCIWEEARRGRQDISLGFGQCVLGFGAVCPPKLPHGYTLRFLRVSRGASVMIEMPA